MLVHLFHWLKSKCMSNLISSLHYNYFQSDRNESFSCFGNKEQTKDVIIRGSIIISGHGVLQNSISGPREEIANYSVPKEKEKKTSAKCKIV